MTHIAKVDLVFSISQKYNLVSNTSIDHRVNYFFLAGRKVKKTILPTRHLRISSFLFIFSSFLFILFPLRAFCLASLLPHNVEFTVVRDFYCSLSIQLLQQTYTHGRGPPNDPNLITLHRSVASLLPSLSLIFCRSTCGDRAPRRSMRRPWDAR